MRAPRRTVTPLQRVGRVIWPTLWFGVIPLLLAGVVFRHLVPGRAPDLAALRWLVHSAGEYPVSFLTTLALMFGAMLYGVRVSLPGSQWFSGSSLLSAASSARSGEAPAWRIARSLSPLLALGVVVMLLWVLSRAFGQVYPVRDAAMLPTLNRGDQVLARALGSRWQPRRGELVVVREPKLQSVPERVGRVLGLAGDTVALRKGRPSINGWEIPACPAGRYLSIVDGERVDAFLLVEFLDDEVYLSLGVPSAPSMDPFEVPAGQVFVLGDNRTRGRAARNGKLEGARGDFTQAIAGKVQQLALRRQPDGQVDPASMLAPIGLDIQIDGLDVADLRARIGTCLAKRPTNTRPPAPNALRAALAGSGGP